MDNEQFIKHLIMVKGFRFFNGDRSNTLFLLSEDDPIATVLGAVAKKINVSHPAFISANPPIRTSFVNDGDVLQASIIIDILFPCGFKSTASIVFQTRKTLQTLVNKEKLTRFLIKNLSIYLGEGEGDRTRLQRYMVESFYK